jgi:hypothetical protein
MNNWYLGLYLRNNSNTWQLLPANGTRVVLLKPRLDALWMESMAAREELAILSDFEISNTN